MHPILKLIYKYAILMMGIILASPVYAQIVLKGNVFDQNTLDPLDKATIFITTADQHNHIINYSTTNEKGEYYFTIIPKGNFIINITHIGYKPSKINVSYHDTLNFLENQISLIKSTETLKEVILNFDRPISVNGDTVDINTKYFEKGSDKVLEDVLKRLPGVEVDDKGKIFINGREIKKVNVENDDLLGKDYQIITKNLSNKAVERIQIIKHYLDDPIYKGLKQSDDIAINLVLTPHVKTKPFGNFDGGMSLNQNYETRLNLISFLPKNKFYFFASGNNTGSDIGFDFNNNNLDDGVFSFGESLILQSLESIDAPNINEIKKRRYLHGNIQFGSQIWINRPNDKTKIQNSISLSKEHRPFHYTTLNNYFGVDSIITKESFRSIFSNLNLTNKTKYEYEFNSKSKIINNLSLTFQPGTFQNRIDLNAIGNIFNSQKRTYLISDEFSYLRKHNERLLGILTGKFLLKSYNNYISLNPGTLNHYFDNSNIQSITQTYNIMNCLMGTNLEILYNVNGINIHSNTSLLMNQNNLITELNGRNDSLSFPAIITKNGNNFLNQNTWGKSDIKITKKQDNITFSIGLGVNLMNVTMELPRNYFFINSTNSIKWELNKLNNFLALYSFSPEIHDINKILNVPVLTDYNKITSGIQHPILVNSSLYLLNYQFGNWSDAFLLSFTALYQKKNKSLTRDIIIKPDYSISRVVRGSPENFLNINANMDKFVKSVSGNIKLKYTYSYTNYSYYIQGFHQVFTSQYHGPQISYRSAFDFPVNINIGTELQISNNQLQGQKKIEINTRFTSFADLYLDFSSGLSGNINLETMSLNRITHKRKLTSFLDISLNKILKPQKISAYITFSNIFDTKMFLIRNISPVEESISEYGLLGRSLILGISLRL